MSIKLVYLLVYKILPKLPADLPWHALLLTCFKKIARSTLILFIKSLTQLCTSKAPPRHDSVGTFLYTTMATTTVTLLQSTSITTSPSSPNHNVIVAEEAKRAAAARRKRRTMILRNAAISPVCSLCTFSCTYDCMLASVSVFLRYQYEMKESN
jgi:hypothetical protein